MLSIPTGERHAQRTATQQPREEKTEEAARAGRAAHAGLSAEPLEKVTSSIAWFPGHMASARKKAAQTMGKIDVVVELLDARLPGASANPLIEKLRRDKQRPCLKILNKIGRASCRERV